MRDPHIVSLKYRLVTNDNEIKIQDPPPLIWETEFFKMQLEDGLATLAINQHHPSVQSARDQVEPSLRAWEILSAQETIGRVLSLQFDGAEVIDRDPPPPGTKEMDSTLTNVCMAMVISEYPPPPKDFVASPDVMTMWSRYCGYRAGREPLGSMAYACLTLLEVSAGGQEKAARQYGISVKVFTTLARLATEVGDREVVRKFTTTTPRPHTLDEINWMQEVIRILIIRAGRWASDSCRQWKEITMADVWPRL